MLKKVIIVCVLIISLVCLTGCSGAYISDDDWSTPSFGPGFGYNVNTGEYGYGFGFGNNGFNSFNVTGW